MMPLKPSHTLAPADIQSHILNHLPEIKQIADVDFEVAFNIDSSDIQIHHWQKLAEIVAGNYEAYDGFVIIHGTDAMVYTASALSFMLQGLSKPVILTGSQRPLAQIRSDARSNLISSLELATYPICEVAIFFGRYLYRGNRTVKISSTHYDAFTSPNYPHLAEVGLDISLTGPLLSAGNSLKYEHQFDNRVFSFHFHPGMDVHHLNYLISSPIRALVIGALGAGNLAISENSLLPWIRKSTEAGKIVVISSQSPYGRVDLNLYQCGDLVRQAGGLSCGDMTLPATVVKLMFLLGQYPENPNQINQLLSKPLAGEIGSNAVERPQDKAGKP